MNKKMLIMDPKDNVGVVLEDVKAGDVCVYGETEVTAAEDIEFCHKVALCDIPQGTEVTKYGQKIGCATMPVQKGQWLHRHNLVSERGR